MKPIFFRDNGDLSRLTGRQHLHVWLVWRAIHGRQRQRITARPSLLEELFAIALHRGTGFIEGLIRAKTVLRRLLG